MRKRLRSSCDHCTACKVRCEGAQPCENCIKRNLSERRRPGPSRKSRTEQYASTEEPSQPIVAMCSQPWALGQGFGFEEMKFLQLYTKFVHPFTPFVNSTIIRDAVFPIPECLSALEEPNAGNMRAAHMAATWGAVAHGAIIAQDPRSAHYVGFAEQALKMCFDIPSVDVLRAYVAVSSANNHSGVKSAAKQVKYTMFANQLYEELHDLPEDVESCMNVMRVEGVLHGAEHEELIAKVLVPSSLSDLDMKSVDMQATYYNTQMLFKFYGKIRALQSGLTPVIDVSQLTEELHWTEGLVRRLEERNGFETNPVGMCMTLIMKGYTQMMLGDLSKSIDTMNPVLEFAQSNPYVIKRPCCWHTLHAASMCTIMFGQHELANRMMQLLSIDASRFLKDGVDVMREGHLLSSFAVRQTCEHLKAQQLGTCLLYLEPVPLPLEQKAPALIEDLTSHLLAKAKLEVSEQPDYSIYPVGVSSDDISLSPWTTDQSIALDQSPFTWDVNDWT